MNSKKKLIITIIASLLLGAALMFTALYFFPLSKTKVINKLEKKVTITDTGISESVAKLYDAVVVVESYKNNQKISSGSGFVYKKGAELAYIITNTHVIDDADKVYLTFSDGSRKEASVLGKDAYSDIAVLSIKADYVLAVATLGSSENAKLGDTVFTIGAPIDSEYYGTVTRGILSGKDRMVEVSIKATNDYVMKVIQTDAALNSGNSGGPIANSNGEVIGVTSMKLVSSGVEGIGFAIPIEDALYYIEKIENNETITRPFLGVSMIDLSDLYNLYQNSITVPEDATGVVIAIVTDDSPAAKAGLKKGDIIYKVGDDEVTSSAELRYYLYKYEPGKTVSMSYIRNNKSSTVKVKLGASE
jgi:serine protease Do